MICPKKVQDVCLFGMMCPMEAIVDDDSECADFIRKTLAEIQPVEADLVEAAERQREREAIRAEMFTVVDEIFEGPDWRKDNPMLQGLETPEAPRIIPLPAKHEPIRPLAKPSLRVVAQKAPLRCRFLHWLRGASPSAVFIGCRLGCRRVVCIDCCSCPEYRGIKWPGKEKKEARNNVADV